MARTADCYMIRYDGPDDDREFCIQRGDNWYWTGDGWSEDYADARLFRDHRTAQTTCNILQYEKHKAKPTRQFQIKMVVTLAATDVNKITERQLIDYLVDAMRIDMETSVFGEGPTEDSYVQARVFIAGMKEI